MLWLAETLTQVPCDFCGSPRFRRLHTRPDGLPVVQCETCGLTFVSPRPKNEELYRLYGDDYYQGAGEVGYADYLSKKGRAERVRSAILRLGVLKHMGIEVKGKVLEVGCATGEFCDIVRAECPLVCDVQGIDISEAAIREARRRHPQSSFRTGSLKDLGSGEQYDMVFAFEVIEHVPCPHDFFQKAAALLTPGGILVLTTPNLECGKRVGFDRWVGFSRSFEHLFFFSQRTLVDYGARQGLRVVGCMTGGGAGLKPPSGMRAWLRNAVRSVAESIRVLELYRRIRSIGHGKHFGYQTRLEKHNLLLVLAKPRTPGTDVTKGCPGTLPETARKLAA